MKKTHVLLTIVLFQLILSCTGLKDSGNDQAAVTDLILNKSVAGSIASVGEVDWYHYHAVEANNVLKVKCTSNTYRPDVDLLVTVYEENEAGKKIRLFATHAPEEAQLPADIQMNVYLATPKDIYISVRDLMDDEASNNQYYLTVDFAGSSEDNNTFSQAEILSVDDAEGCQHDTISRIGDVDCFTFDASSDGVYAVKVDFSQFFQTSDVALSIDLYDSDGRLIRSLEKGQREHNLLVHYLPAGTYYVLVDDFGRDDFDTASPYQICVESVPAEEKNENDRIDNAAVAQYDPVTQTFTSSGALEYWQDKDCYRLPLESLDTTGFKVLKLTFDDGDQAVECEYQIRLEDSGENILLAHNYLGGSTQYQTEIKAGERDHFVLIQAAKEQAVFEKAPYTVTVEILDVEDPAELVDKGQGRIGNDTIDTADVLLTSADPADATVAKIGYRGDVDWYAVSVTDPTTPQVLEVFLDTNSEPSYVDYYVSILRDDVIKKLFDTDGGDGGTELKTSVLIPALTSPTPVTYFLRVSDYQGDDGDGDIPYRLRANLRQIPTALLQNDPSITGTIVYYGETEELTDLTAETVKVEYNSLLQKQYRANRDLLNFNVLNPVNGIEKTKDGTVTTIALPWIAGYIDYEGDQDWFKLDFAPLLEQGVDPASNWYYDIKIDLHVGNPGSATEYVWKLYRDKNNNQILVDRSRDSNGFFASAGDLDIVKQPFDITTPAAGSSDEFWVGDSWEGNFYFSMSDFNYIDSAFPDDDWGYDDAPYYFKITLTYHPGVSYP